jgi:hypothetical protein
MVSALMSDSDINLATAHALTADSTCASCAVMLHTHSTSVHKCTCTSGMERYDSVSKLLPVLLAAAGGPGMVKAAYESGHLSIGVGAGNTPAVIDASADIAMAVSSILISKTFGEQHETTTLKITLLHCTCARLVPQSLGSTCHAACGAHAGRVASGWGAAG